MAWYQESVFYHIYPLGMVDAPKENDYGEPVHRLREVEKWIPHIKSLGCNGLYIGPLFESVGHGYETTDYRKLDSRLGDNEDLKRFVCKCHEEGIRVIFDGVFNHTGRDFFAFQDIKKNRENSIYKDWYCNVNFWGNNEYNDGFSYDNWGGYNLLVKLNQKNPAVRDYICDVIRFWVNEFDVDGIRLDAADVLDFDFMRALRYVADTVKPDFWLMGEVIHGDYTRWVNNNTLHSVTNYVLHKALYSGHNDHNYFEIAHTVRRLSDMFSNNWNNISLYNFTDNHDVERIYTKLNNKANFYPVHILEYTLPGVPSIYYGSEFGIEGKKEKYSDASLRPAMKYEDYENAIEVNQYASFIKTLGKVRNLVKSLSYGDYKEVSLQNRQYMFTRNTDRFTSVVVVNNDENSCTVRGNGIRDGVYRGVLSNNILNVSGGYAEVTIPANYGEIYVMEEELNDSKIEFSPIVKAVCEKDPEREEVRDELADSDTEFFNKEPSYEEAKTDEAEDIKEEADIQEEKEAEEILINNASKKYGLDDKYSMIDPDIISNRWDYENMSVEELQIGILEKMAKNGPVNNDMIRTVMDNIYPNSLLNWIQSFR